MPSSSLAYYKLAINYKQKEDNANALDCLAKSIKFNPKNAMAHFEYAKLCEQSGNNDLAIESYSKAAKFDIKIAKECNMNISKLKNTK